MLNGDITWDEYYLESKEVTREKCTGCSWSNGDRGLDPPMVSFNPNILRSGSLPVFDQRDIRMQNIWVQAQMSVMSS